MESGQAERHLRSLPKCVTLIRFELFSPDIPLPNYKRKLAPKSEGDS